MNEEWNYYLVDSGRYSCEGKGLFVSFCLFRSRTPQKRQRIGKTAKPWQRHLVIFGGKIVSSKLKPFERLYSGSLSGT
jgi:hypothetical protein